ncbi:MAG: hypothetical protein R3B82_06235 [Sandaracinaceae bacterium]
MPFRAILLACLVLLPCAGAQAQGPRVLALAPERPIPDWPAHLAVELAPLGGQVLRSPLAMGPSAEDPTLAARVAAQVVGADAAVWIDGDGAEIHVALASARSGFRAPLAAQADARTIALVAASLLEEAFATAEPTGTPLPTHGTPREQLGPPVEPVRQLDDRERAPVNRALDPPASEGIQVTGFGAIGTGGFAWLSDVHFDPGSFIRGALGLRVGDAFQFQTIAEVGLVREHIGTSGGLEMQPYGRLCPEVAWLIPADAFVALQLGAHGCVGIAELRYFIAFDFPTEGPVVLAAGGGYVGLELRPTRAVSVTFRLDLDGTVPVESTQFGSVPREADVMAAFSTMVGFH